MNAVKTGLTVLGLMVGMVTMAQNRDRNHGTPEERAQRRTEKLAHELSLSDAQKEQFKSIHLEAIKQRDAIRANTKLTAEQLREELKTGRQAEKAKLEALLTEEQKKVLEKKMADMKEKRHAMRSGDEERLAGATPGQRAAFKTQRLAESLALTEDQKIKLTELNLRTEQKRDAIRSDATQSDEQKKAAMKELHRSRKTELSQILTKEQLDKLKALKHRDGPEKE
jgi:hypothetical protein